MREEKQSKGYKSTCLVCRGPIPGICLGQCFSTFFPTGPHYGPSASLTGRTHLIYILRHQFKPTRFIILFIILFVILYNIMTSKRLHLLK